MERKTLAPSISTSKSEDAYLLAMKIRDDAHMDVVLLSLKLLAAQTRLDASEFALKVAELAYKEAHEIQEQKRCTSCIH